MPKKNKSKNKDEQFFWETAGIFLNHELPDIRKKSLNTVASYRSSLNIYIDEARGRFCCFPREAAEPSPCFLTEYYIISIIICVFQL
jgi:hypothetical protein